MTTEYLERPEPFAELHVPDPPPKCYIAGPMRGIPAFNFPAFHSLAAHLRSRGWEVFNPAENDENVYPNIAEWPGYAVGDTKLCPDFNLHVAMRWDLARITESQAIVFLPGWEKSSGAATEKTVAEACGLALLFAYPTTIPGEWSVSNVHYADAG